MQPTQFCCSHLFGFWFEEDSEREEKDRSDAKIILLKTRTKESATAAIRWLKKELSLSIVRDTESAQVRPSSRRFRDGEGGEDDRSYIIIWSISVPTQSTWVELSCRKNVDEIIVCLTITVLLASKGSKRKVDVCMDWTESGWIPLEMNGLLYSAWAYLLVRLQIHIVKDTNTTILVDVTISAFAAWEACHGEY